MRDLLKILGIFFFGLLTANVLIRGECEEQAEDNALDSGCSTSKKTEHHKGNECRNTDKEKSRFFPVSLILICRKTAERKGSQTGYRKQDKTFYEHQRIFS